MLRFREIVIISPKGRTAAGSPDPNATTAPSTTNGALARAARCRWRAPEGRGRRPRIRSAAETPIPSGAGRDGDIMASCPRRRWGGRSVLAEHGPSPTAGDLAGLAETQRPAATSGLRPMFRARPGPSVRTRRAARYRGRGVVQNAAAGKNHEIVAGRRVELSHLRPRRWAAGVPSSRPVRPGGRTCSLLVARHEVLQRHPRLQEQLGENPGRRRSPAPTTNQRDHRRPQKDRLLQFLGHAVGREIDTCAASGEGQAWPEHRPRLLAVRRVVVQLQARR